MTLTASERLGVRIFGDLARRELQYLPRLPAAMHKAHMPRSPEVYVAFVNLVAAAALLEGLLLLAVVALVLPAAGAPVPEWAVAVAALAPVMFPAAVLLLGRVWPDFRASERAALIDHMLPASLNYMAAMASSGMPPDRILASLGRQRVYGEVAEEAHRVSAQMRWIGKDILTALREAIETTPSAKLQDVWQGMASTIGSGASLKVYLLAKAEQMHRDNAAHQRRDLDTLGIIAETFLVVAVAAPVFLILLLTIMGTSGSGASSARMILWLLVLVLLPVAQGGFAFVVHSMRRRV